MQNYLLACANCPFRVTERTDGVRSYSFRNTEWHSAHANYPFRSAECIVGMLNTFSKLGSPFQAIIVFLLKSGLLTHLFFRKWQLSSRTSHLLAKRDKLLLEKNILFMKKLTDFMKKEFGFGKKEFPFDQKLTGFNEMDIGYCFSAIAAIKKAQHNHAALFCSV